MRGSSKRDARKFAVKTWRAKALEMRVEGRTLPEIARAMGKALSTVHEAIAKELAEIPAPGVDNLREVDGARLDAIIRGHLAAARKGDAESAHVVIAAIRQRSKLFGTEAPKRTELSGPDGGPIPTGKASPAEVARAVRDVFGEMAPPEMSELEPSEPDDTTGDAGSPAVPDSTPSE